MSEKRCSRRASGPAGNLTQIYAHRKKEDEEERFRKMWEEFEQSEEGAEIDPEQFLRDMAILDELNPLPDFDVSMSWAEFKEKYGYLLESLNPADQQSSASVEKPKKRRRVKPVQLFLSAIAILAMLSIASSCGILDCIIEAIADWTEDTFGFRVMQEFHAEDIEPENADIEPYTSLEDALSDLGVTTAYIPTWYPNGYLFEKVRIQDYSYATKILAEYNRGKEEILLTIWHYKDSAALKHQAAEKLPPDAKPYTRNEIKHYILDNSVTTSTTWIAGTEMYIFLGDYSTEDAIKMIDSIYKGIN